MSNDTLLAAAGELDEAAQIPAGDAAEWLLRARMAALASELRQLHLWLSRPAPTPCRCQAPALAPSPRLSAALTPREASELLNISERTLARLAAAGELHPMKRGRLVRYRREDLVRYLADATGDRSPSET